MNAVKETIATYTKGAKALLNNALSSAEAFERAVEEVAYLAEKLKKYLEKKAPHLLTDDATPMSLVAEVGSAAIGTNTYAEANLTARLVQTDLVSIAVASSISRAAADGGAQFASSTSFIDAPGSDFSFTKTKTFTGGNFQYTKEIMVAVDFEFIDGYSGSITREVNVVAEQLHKRLDEGNFATVEFDLVAQGENSLVVAESDVLVVADALSTAYVGADLFIA